MMVDYINFSTREKRAKYIFEHFQKYLGKKILDVGCDKAELKALIGDIDYLGLDITGTPNIRLDLEMVERLPFNDSFFDCVIAADVLEHLDNLHLIFSELLRVSRKYIIISWPNNWVNARVPLQRGYGSFKHYGLPLEKPKDRHKWFFSFSEAKGFVLSQIRKNSNIQLIEERISEKPKFFLFRLIRHLRYLKRECYLNRYAHTYWTVLRKS